MRVSEDTLLASAVRTTTQTGAAVLSPDSIGDVDYVEAILDVTAGATLSVTLSIEEYIEAAAAYRTVIAATALTAAGVARVRVGPSVPAAANVSATGLIPRQFRVVVTHGNANNATYSLTLRRGRA